jgi:hypothetical protein
MVKGTEPGLDPSSRTREGREQAGVSQLESAPRHRINPVVTDNVPNPSQDLPLPDKPGIRCIAMVSPGHNPLPGKGFHPMNDRMFLSGSGKNDEIPPLQGPPRLGLEDEEIALPEGRKHAASSIDQGKHPRPP